MTLAAGARDWRLGLLLVLALLVRVPPLFTAMLNYDDGIEALMSQDVLQGRLPVFFYGQPAHGSADRYPAAIVVWLLGPTVLAAQLGPLVLSIVLVASLALVTGRIFGGRAGLLAGLYVAVPPYYLFGWSFDGRGHYPMIVVLGAWTLCLAWRILAEGIVRSPLRRFVGLGLLVGLAWWTNYLSVTYLAPLGLVLAAAGIAAPSPRARPLLARAVVTLGGLVVGAAPFLVYQVASRPVAVLRGAVSPAVARAYAGDLVVDGLPKLLGVHPMVWRGGQRIAYAVVAALAVLVLLHGLAWALRRGRPAADRLVVACLLATVAVTLALSVFTWYGSIVRYPRYLWPLYLALPPLAGIALDRLARVSPALPLVAMVPVVANNLLGTLVLGPVLAPARDAHVAHHWRTSTAEQLALFDRLRVDRVYGGTPVWSYLSGRRILVADPMRERMIELARAVDAAPRMAWVIRPSEPVEPSLATAGIRFRRTDGPGFAVLTDFELATGTHADVDTVGWSARATPGTDSAHRAFDRHVLTHWRAAESGPSAYQLDLGGLQQVGMVSWIPRAPEELPGGFRLAISADGRAWQEVAHVSDYAGPLYWSGTHPFLRPRRGRVEVRFAPVAARHVRLEGWVRPGRSVAWSIAEIFVGAPAGACPLPPEPSRLVRTLTEAGVRFVYADHWLSAALHVASDGRIGVLPSNRTVDSNGRVMPPLDTVEALRPRPHRAVVVEDCPPQVAAAAAALLEDSGVGFTREATPGFVIFRDLRDPRQPDRPARWTAGVAPRNAIEVDPGPLTSLSSVTVECAGAAAVAPDAIRLETSEDGAHFTETAHRLVRPGTLRVHGSRLLRDPSPPLRLDFPPARLRALRIVARESWPAWCPVAAVRVGGLP